MIFAVFDVLLAAVPEIKMDWIGLEHTVRVREKSNILQLSGDIRGRLI